MQTDITSLTAQIVSAYCANNPLATAELPTVINTVHGALTNIGKPAVAVAEPQQPAVPVKRSVTPDSVVCLECGAKMKMLKRHLKTDHGLTVEEYRAKWNLSFDHPMVAPNYAKVRSSLAKKHGLGKKK